jgi:hypothetical protein
MATALALLVGGIGLLVGAAWAVPAYLVAMGMLLYTAVVSPGYFAQKGQWAWVAIFGVIIVLATASIIMVLR